MTLTLDRIGQSPSLAVEHGGPAGGGGDGKFVMFLHGIGGRRQNFTRQLPAFAENFHAAAWDARGYGDSDDYRGDLEFSDFSRDLIRVLDHFSVDKAHLVGQSMGGRISLDFYALFPDRVATLTLCGVHASFGDFTEAQRREFVDRRRKPLVEDGKTPADMAPELASHLMAPGGDPHVFDQIVASVSALHVDSYIKTIEATTHYDRSAILGRIKVPTLVVVGEHDALTSVEMKRDLASRIPGARFEIMAGCGHMANMEQPDEFNRLVGGFLDENSG
jgi:3-oxoadipate enol-lactonase